MNPCIVRRLLAGTAAATLIAMTAGSALAADVQVRIVNLTRGQVFSPPIVWSHGSAFAPFFAFGGVASEELRAIAEDGDPGPMEMFLMTEPAVRDIAIADGPIPPGGSLTLAVDVGPGQRLISLASMLVNTNDTFFALRGVDSPALGQTATFFQPGLDAGTEDNTEACADIPGPACADIDPGNNDVDGDGEGFIFTQEGIHGLNGGVATSDLDPSQQDWRNPVAYIVMTK